MGQTIENRYLVSDSKQALSVIAISDKIKETSVATIKEMQEMGIDLYMLTGDNRSHSKK